MLRSLVKDNEVGGLIFTEGFIAQYADMTNYAQAQASVPLLMTFDGEWGLRMRIPKLPASRTTWHWVPYTMASR